MAYREDILNGKLQIPGYYSILEEYGYKVAFVANKFWGALWNAYLKNKGTVSLPYWSEKFNDALVFNVILKALSDAGWLDSSAVPLRNWGEASINETKLLNYVSMKELEYVRAHKKFMKYRLKLEDEATRNNLTRIQGKIKDTGLVRTGFMKAGNTKFQFDTNAILKHYAVVIAETTKSMRKMRQEWPDMVSDSASYDEISQDIVDAIIYENGTYSSGQNLLDSRGRNIHGMLDKVFNPVSFKVARACLVIPEEYRRPATAKGLKNKYLFIAELLGFKKGSKLQKELMGKHAYATHKVLDLDLTTEAGQKDQYENIWLERTYTDIDNYYGGSSLSLRIYKRRIAKGTKTKEPKAVPYKWVVPIEIDMSASVLGFVGLITNHKPFLERCNMLPGDLTDAWEIKGIPKRKQAKVIMRTIYGSAASCQDMWKDAKIPYTNEDVIAYDKALKDGEIAIGDRFSKFIISNCNPKEEMELHVRGEKFQIECNRYRYVGEKAVMYDLYDTETQTVRRINHITTRKVPDLQQFRRYFVTGLIHNLDGQVCNTVTNVVYDTSKWVIDIHDAFILCAEMADLARDRYAKELEDIHTNRNSILTNYFTSIGVSGLAHNQWQEVKKAIEPLEDEFKCNEMVLK